MEKSSLDSGIEDPKLTHLLSQAHQNHNNLQNSHHWKDWKLPEKIFYN